MLHFHVPSTKGELIAWLKNFYGTNEPKWAKMPKKQLYAIYFSIRRRIN